MLSKPLHGWSTFNLDDWVSFIGYYEVDFETKKAQLVEKLKRLKELIGEKGPCLQMKGPSYKQQ